MVFYKNVFLWFFHHRSTFVLIMVLYLQLNIPHLSSRWIMLGKCLWAKEYQRGAYIFIDLIFQIYFPLWIIRSVNRQWILWGRLACPIMCIFSQWYDCLCSRCMALDHRNVGAEVQFSLFHSFLYKSLLYPSCLVVTLTSLSISSPSIPLFYLLFSPLSISSIHFCFSESSLPFFLSLSISSHCLSVCVVQAAAMVHFHL